MCVIGDHDKSWYCRLLMLSTPSMNEPLHVLSLELGQQQQYPLTLERRTSWDMSLCTLHWKLVSLVRNMWLLGDLNDVYHVNVPVLMEHMMRQLMSVLDLSELNFGKIRRGYRNIPFVCCGGKRRAMWQWIYLLRHQKVKQWRWASMNPYHRIDKMNLNAYLDLVCFTHMEVEASRGWTLVIKSILSRSEGSPHSDHKHYGQKLVSINSC